jgi:hypothetical protein
MKNIYIACVVILCVILGISYIKKDTKVAVFPQIEQEILACAGIEISSPLASSTVSFPLSVSGTIHPIAYPGTWIVFEGEAGTVVVVDSAGNTISDPVIMSLDVDWMNTDPKPFSLSIPSLTIIPSDSNITLHFTDNNPSGDGQFRICDVSVNLLD